MKTRTLAFTIHNWTRRARHRGELPGVTIGWLTVTWFGGSLIEFFEKTNANLRALRERLTGGLNG